MRHAISLIGKKGLMPPLGLLTIAGYFPRDEFDLLLVDMNVSRLRDRDLAEADLVMLSAMLVQKDSFFEVVASAADGDPRRGGRALSERLPRGYGGHRLPRPRRGRGDASALHRGLAQGACVPRLFRRGQALPRFDAPMPRFDLIDAADYANMPLQFSRGCPFNCEFCDIVGLFGRVPRTKSRADSSRNSTSSSGSDVRARYSSSTTTSSATRPA